MKAKLQLTTLMKGLIPFAVRAPHSNFIAAAVFLLALNTSANAQDTTYKMGEGWHISHWGAEKDPNTFDVRLFRSINSSRSNFKDSFLPTVNRTFMPILISMPIAMVVYGATTGRNYDENTGYLLAVSQVTNYLMTFGIKYVSNRLRPYLSLRNVYYRLILAESLYSFPSGHTSHSINMATTFALRYPKQPYIYLPMYAWAFTIAYARSYFGLHYPVDIFGGAGIGLVSSVLVYSLRVQIFKALRGYDIRDSNDDFGTSGVAASAAFFLSSAANMFITPFFKNNKKGNFDISFSPVTKRNAPGVGIDIKF